MYSVAECTKSLAALHDEMEGISEDGVVSGDVVDGWRTQLQVCVEALSSAQATPPQRTTTSPPARTLSLEPKLRHHSTPQSSFRHVARSRSFVENSPVSLPQSAPSVLCGALHVLLEAVSHRARASRAVCYIVNNDQLQAIGMVGAGLPQVRKVGSDENWTLNVLNSGIGVNVHTAVAIDAASSLSKATAKNMLCFPLTCLTDPTQRFGVVQLFDKDAGKAPFSAQDEAVLSCSLSLFTYIIQYYPGTPLRWSFDARVLHKVKPFKIPKPQLNIGARFAKEKGEEKAEKLLVYRSDRTRKPFINQLKASAKALEQCSDLIDTAADACDLQVIEEYIQGLEDCWRNSVTLNTECLIEREASLGKIHHIREGLARERRAVQTAEVQCKEQERLSHEYHLSYNSIVSDLQTVISNPSGTGRRGSHFLKPAPPGQPRLHVC